MLFGLLFYVLEKALPFIVLIGFIALIWWIIANWNGPSGDTYRPPNNYYTPPPAQESGRKKSKARRYYPRFRRSRSFATSKPKRKGSRTAFEKAMYPKPRRRKQ